MSARRWLAHFLPAAPEPNPLAVAERNPLAGPDEHYCPKCGGNVHDQENGVDVIRDCPVCEVAA